MSTDRQAGYDVFFVIEGAVQRDVDTRIRQLIEQLEKAMARPDAPVLDLEWLILRCRDTLQYRGDVKTASIDHLVADLKALELEYPGVLPAAFVQAL